ncbi:HD-GYP domain-containing protein [Azovibrio restrictus]|uniref:HD-GYP domain-containing protein n=1 Tax=Azovibrio restrictus TaxID=146938 RepID=UPI0026E96D6F|nr:HD-GYP domain-containing protein [Azovibrio restrictus]
MPTLDIDRLQPGIFISLAGVGWLNHPFLLNQFRIANEKQIQALREMGLKTVEWDPQQSTAQPLPEATVHEDEPDFGGMALAGMLDEKRQRVARVQAQRDRLARREREFEQEAASATEVLKEMTSRPTEAHAKAQAMVGRMVEGLLGAESVAIHLVNLKGKDHGLAFHALNVMVLSLLLGQAMKLPAEDLKNLGLGALFHDAGKGEIPPRILRAASRTPPEEEFYRAHVGYGIKAVAGMKNMSTPARNIIACHHESWDGSGFPNRLAGEKIPRLARIVAIANRYDNLCNPFDLKQARTPAEALGLMFRGEAGRYDPELLQRFVKTLGVFPPGSFVSLNNGAVGLVVESNPADLLHPLIMLHDADVPRSEAILLDLRDTDLKIEAALSPAKLPFEVVEYLAPRGRIDYYIEGAA